MPGRGVSKYGTQSDTKSKEKPERGKSRTRDQNPPCSDKTNGSRFQALAQTCKHCDMSCGENDDLQCINCNVRSHLECESLENDILLDMKSRGNFLCESCKKLPDRGDSIFSDVQSESRDEMETSTMDSDDRRMAENDEEPKTQKSHTQAQVTAMDVNNSSGKLSPTLASTPIRSDKNASMTHNVPNQRDAHNQPTNSQLGYQLNIIMEMVSTTKEQVGKLEQKINLIEENQEVYLDKRVVQLQENAHKTVSDALKKLGPNLKDEVEQNVIKSVEKRMDIKIQKKVTQKFDENVTKQIEQEVGKKFEEQVDLKVDEELMQKVDQKINEKLAQMDQKVDEKINQLGYMVDDKIDEALEEYQDKNWRRKNLIIVNVPESTKKPIIDRKNDDYLEVYQIINKLVDFEEGDLECKPVRIGKFQNDKPRLMRVTFKSEYLARDVANKARENSEILNPEEKDNKKKIYINKDFSLKDREQRKEALKEYKERTDKGEEGLTVFRNKVIKKDDLLEQGHLINRKTYRGRRGSYASTVSRRPFKNYYPPTKQNGPVGMVMGPSASYVPNRQVGAPTTQYVEDMRPREQINSSTVRTSQNDAQSSSQPKMNLGDRDRQEMGQNTGSSVKQDDDKFRLPRPLMGSQSESMKWRSPMHRNDMVEDLEMYGAVGPDYRPMPQHMFRECPPNDHYYREGERYYMPGYERGHPRISRGGAPGTGRGSQGNFFPGY